MLGSKAAQERGGIGAVLSMQSPGKSPRTCWVCSEGDVADVVQAPSAKTAAQGTMLPGAIPLRQPPVMAQIMALTWPNSTQCSGIRMDGIPSDLSGAKIVVLSSFQ